MPASFCTWPGCRAIHQLPGDLCGEHRQLARERAQAGRRRAAARRASAATSGYGTEYRRNRQFVVNAAKQAAADGQPLACAICTRPLEAGQALTAEHLKPVRDGGGPELANLAAAHAACNTAWNRPR